MANSSSNPDLDRGIGEESMDADCFEDDSRIAAVPARTRLPNIHRSKGGAAGVGGFGQGRRAQSMPQLHQASVVSQLTMDSLGEAYPSVISGMSVLSAFQEEDEVVPWGSPVRSPFHRSLRSGWEGESEEGEPVRLRSALKKPSDASVDSMADLSQKLRRSVSFTALGGAHVVATGHSKPPPHNQPQKKAKEMIQAAHKEDDGEDEEDDDDEEIGWSPFVIPVQS